MEGIIENKGLSQRKQNGLPEDKVVIAIIAICTCPRRNGAGSHPPLSNVTVVDRLLAQRHNERSELTEHSATFHNAEYIMLISIPLHIDPGETVWFGPFVPRELIFVTHCVQKL